MFREIKEDRNIDREKRYKQNEKAIKIEIIKKNQKEIPKLKNTITEMKIHLEGYKISFEHAEDSISKPEDRTTEIIRSEEQKEKRMSKKE